MTRRSLNRPIVHLHLCGRVPAFVDPYLPPYCTKCRGHDPLDVLLLRMLSLSVIWARHNGVSAVGSSSSNTEANTCHLGGDGGCTREGEAARWSLYQRTRLNFVDQFHNAAQSRWMSATLDPTTTAMCRRSDRGPDSCGIPYLPASTNMKAHAVVRVVGVVV